MAGEKKGAKKTVGKTRKSEAPKYLVRLSYVQKPNGAYAPRLENIFLGESGGTSDTAN
jgi:hypothetical protein